VWTVCPFTPSRAAISAAPTGTDLRFGWLLDEATMVL
jgi:hypothetical protein